MFVRALSKWVVCFALAACSSEEAAPAPKPTYVLVHGAWMGAWAWDDVAVGLRSAGVKVVVVELPGHGADRTAPTAVSLASYVAAVRSAVDSEPAPVVLVAHSMGGVVATEVAEERPDRVAKLVYLAAFVPKEGDTLQSLAAADSASQLGAALAIDPAAGTASVPPASLTNIFCGDCTEAEAARLTASSRAEPLAAFGTPVHVTAAAWGRVPKYYVYTRNDHAISYGAQQAMTAGVPLVSSATLDTSHSPFLSHPAVVATTLLGFEGGNGS